MYSAENVIAQIIGGQKQVFDGVQTVADVRSKLGASSSYTAKVNGSDAGDDQQLSSGDYVTFAKGAKGGLN